MPAVAPLPPLPPPAPVPPVPEPALPPLPPLPPDSEESLLLPQAAAQSTAATAAIIAYRIFKTPSLRSKAKE